MEQQKTSPGIWYEKTWLVILLCFAFFPLGLYALWKNTSIHKGMKVAATILIVLFAIAVFTSDPPPVEGDTAPTASEAPAEPRESPRYQVVKIDNNYGRLHCRVTIDDLYSREALIEETRRLREEHKAEGNFTVYYYYKKYTDKTSPVAGLTYPEDCGLCEYKDKEGDPIDFPFYYLQKTMANALRALTFDTAGYKQEAVFLNLYGTAVRNIILSSDNQKALFVYQSTTGHSAHALVKKVVDGEDRFYEPAEESDSVYYRINRDQGFIDLYKDEALNAQYILED